MSFELAMSGINAVSASLETISNNIANAGTTGFKSSRTNFSAVYSGTEANGAEAASQTQSIEKSGGLMNTGRGMDAVIQGRGFFAVKDTSGQTVFSRVGSFSLDKDGFVVDTNGRKVQGYAAQLDSAGRPIPGGLGSLGDLKVPTGQITAQPSDQLKFTGNLSADWTVPATTPFDKDTPTSFNSSITSVVYDSQGAKHSITQYFVKTGTNNVDVYVSLDNQAVTTPTTTLNFDAQGQLASSTTATPTLPATTMNGANPLTLTIDYSGSTQFAGDTTTLANSANGYASGTLTGTSIGEDGSVVATYTNGQKQTIGTIALATFANEGALTVVNNTSWVSNAATGAALFAAPGTAAASKLTAGALEQSNVDMTGELVDLMTAQRSYQANTKVLSAESEMMQSLMQAI